MLLTNVASWYWDSPINKTLYFYAPLTVNVTPTVVSGNDYSVRASSYNSVSSDGLYFNNGNHYIIWNSEAPSNMNLTFSCWVKRTNGSGINFSFGTANPSNARYKGMQLTQYNNYWLVTEYLYFCRVNSNYMPETNNYVFITWTLINNGNGNYTCKFYKNGVLNNTVNVTNSSYLGMADTYFAISHNTGNTMHGYFKHFSCYEELTDAEVRQLYQNSGIPTNI